MSKNNDDNLDNSKISKKVEDEKNDYDAEFKSMPTNNYVYNNKNFNPYTKKNKLAFINNFFKKESTYKDVSHKIKINGKKRNMMQMHNRYYVIFKLLLKSWFTTIWGPITAFVIPTAIICFIPFLNLPNKQSNIDILVYTVSITILSINLTNFPALYVEYKKSSLLKRIATTPLSKKEFLSSLITFNLVMTLAAVLYVHILAFGVFNHNFDFNNMHLGYVVLGYILVLFPMIILGLLIATISKTANFAAGLGGWIVTITLVFMILQQQPSNIFDQPGAFSHFLKIINYLIPFTYGQKIIYANYWTASANVVYWYDYVVPIVYTIGLSLITLKLFSWDK